MRSYRVSFGMLMTAMVLAAANRAFGNPSGGTVRQGSASFSSSGSQLTITTSSQTFINWQSFNIGVGETTTFVQPSSSSVVWNQISDPNPSQILGNLNANGYVVLQNQNGFFIGGQASIATHGLLLTTAPIPMPDLSSGGPWAFSTPPPTASIINYGQINIGGGGSAFLIANDIENHGSIDAPGGNIGLYAGQQVLVSTRPDGRGLSAKVTLPEGSVDNEGKLIADGGTIAMHAQVVNQGGLVQANTVANVNGTIELLASDAMNLGANSVISAKGDGQGVSSGGSVTVKSDNTFSDQAGSAINIAGGAQAGNGGQAEISSANLNGIQSVIDGRAVKGFQGGIFTIDPTATDLNLTSAFISGLTPTLLSGLYQINLEATHNITLAANTTWTLSDPGGAALLSLTAGNDIILNAGSAINAGKNWSLSLSAGPQNLATKPTTARTDGIYLDGNATIQAVNGNVNLWAANEVLLNSGAVRTIGSGNISVTTLLGNVNTGSSPSGFNYLTKATSGPFYTPFSINLFTGQILATSTLGGISTANGGNVTINSGGDVTSLLPGTSAIADAGAGAFGSAPGNVSITAKGNVYGHYVLVNGTGSITAGQNIGNANQNVALSLVDGGWTLNAGGNIYLQEVRNPNGVFDQPSSVTAAGYHLFDYGQDASVGLTAGNGVYLTGANRGPGSVPVIYPPSLDITAGAGGVNLQSALILFPSPDQNLTINTTDGGWFTGLSSGAQISMSDTSTRHWTSTTSFGLNDVGTSPLEINNPNAVVINISGSMANIGLDTDKQTKITVGGDMIGCNFAGQNLHETDKTTIDVTGKIENRISFNSIFLPPAELPILPVIDLPPGLANDWKAALRAAVDPTAIANVVIPAGADPSTYKQNFVNAKLLFNNIADNFYYNAGTGRLTYAGQLDLTLAGQLEKPLTVVRYGPDGNPVVAKGPDGQLHFVTDTISWGDAAGIANLAKNSQGAPALSDTTGGYVVGGPGLFKVDASSISLGNTLGIISYGVGGVGSRYNYLAPYTPAGASIEVTVANDTVENGVSVASLEMPASTIAALGGGNVTVTSTGGSMDLGSQDLLDVEQAVVQNHAMALGIYTSGPGDVNVTTLGNIAVDSSRIAAFDGGKVTVVSLQGNIDAGIGGLNIVPIWVYYVDPLTGKASAFKEDVYANGIVAETLMGSLASTGGKKHHHHGPTPPPPPPIPGAATLPGDIILQTPRGDILANAGGILQEALSGNVEAPGPIITLTAGTPASDGSPGYVGNISLGAAGVIGGAITATANGNISGLVISRQDSSINAAANFTGTVLSGGTASVGAGGTVTGTIIGITGANVSGGQGVTADVLSQNASVNGATATSTLGTTATATTASQDAAGQATDTAKEQVASDDSQDDEKKKKKGSGPALTHRVGRVTVLLPKAI